MSNCTMVVCLYVVLYGVVETMTVPKTIFMQGLQCKLLNLITNVTIVLVCLYVLHWPNTKFIIQPHMCNDM